METLRSISAGTVLAVLVIAATSNTVDADISDIVVTVTTDRTFYEVGDSVEITVAKCNPTQDPITVTYACACCHDDVLILESSDAVTSDCTPDCVDLVVDVTWQPGECKSDVLIWSQRAPFCAEGGQVNPGHYRVQNFSHFPAFSRITRSPEFVIDREVTMIQSSIWTNVKDARAA